MWARGFAGHYNFLQGLTCHPGHTFEGEADGHDLVRFLAQNSVTVPAPAAAGAQAPAGDDSLAILPSDIVSLFGSHLPRIKDPKLVLQDEDEWRLPTGFTITDKPVVGKTKGPFLKAFSLFRTR